MNQRAKPTHQGEPHTDEGLRAARDQEFLCSRERPTVDESTPELRLVDLFSGCGGMSLGFERAAHASGFRVETALAVDIDPLATEVYGANFSGLVETASVTDVLDGVIGAPLTDTERGWREAVGRADVLIGGPPCQGHSDLNNHSRRTDSRNELYLVMGRAAEVFEPELVMVENVPAVRHARQGVVPALVAHLKALGYGVGERVLDVSRLGVPQTRRRHILLAARGLNAASVQHHLDKVERDESPRTLDWAIRDLDVEPEANTPEFDRPARVSQANQQRMQWFADHPGEFDLPDKHRPPCHRDKPHSYKSVYGRLSWELPAQTITTGFTSMGQGRFVHPSRLRTLTPHEAARLQGFPDYFDFIEGEGRRTAWSKLIGNAVPPFLSERVFRGLLDDIEVE